MSKYSGTKTEKNLLAAFAGESQARNKYTYFSAIAKRTDLIRLQTFLLKPPPMKKTMQKCGSKSLAA